MRNIIPLLYYLMSTCLIPTSSALSSPAEDPTVAAVRNLQLADAVRNGQVDEVSQLLERGAAIATTDDRGDTLLHLACQYGHFKVAKLLVDHGADISARNKQGRTPLHDAASMGDYETAILLIDKGADIKAVTKFGDTPLHFASEMRNFEMAELVGAMRGATRGAKSTYEWKTDNVKVAEILIARGADVNAQNTRGLTPLHRTTPWNNVAVAKLLLAHGALVDLKDESGNTAKDAARKNGAREIVALIDHHAKNN